MANYAHTCILLIKTLLNLKNIYISKHLHTGKYYANLESVPIVYELKLVATKKLKTVLEIIQNWKRRIGYVYSVIYVWGGISFTALPQPYICVCLKLGPGFPSPYGMVFFIFYNLR